ncbi:MAG TPA: TIGR03617 family F420-dependent LLM class oxidoreductase [Mycobacteriales bacterium]|nr:TIGR03617 family F420-dependent LLM class oxidoreductase [Mycobacteriales bacterium]
MKVDQALPIDGIDARDIAARALDQGYDGIWAGETKHDPLLALALAASVAPGLDVGTSISVAFARNPMDLAISANDLQTFTQGHFFLGLGSQVKAHITRRYSMPWSHPAPRMREFVLAMRAIWDAWAGDGRLSFEGDFYQHTLMTPFFNPGPNPYGPPKVLLAGVGAVMTEVAGEVADGFLCHGFTTERFIREVTVPALQRGAAKSGRDAGQLEILGGPFVVTGRNEAEFATADQAVRNQIAFYASTPAYRAVLELHGWGPLQIELNALTKANRWSEMGGLITDDVLNAFAVVGEPDEIAPEMLRRYGDLWSRMSLYTPYQLNREVLEPIMAGLQASTQR